MEKETMSLPMVALRAMTVLPEMVRHFDISREKSLTAIEEALAGSRNCLYRHRSVWIRRIPGWRMFTRQDVLSQ